MNYPDICEGCLIYENSYKKSCSFAYVKYNKDVLVCPCSTCLIKMMCRRSCYLLKEHGTKIELIHKKDI
jgi:hypothetical protein